MSKKDKNSANLKKGVEGPVVEKIVNRRVRNDMVEYYVKWKGHCTSKNSWKPKESLDCQDLIQQYELKRKEWGNAAAAKKGHLSSPKVTSSGQTCSSTSVEGGNGFHRGLKAEKIMGVNQVDDDLVFLVQFKGCDEPELIPAKVANKKIPQMVIKFYEERISWYSDGDVSD